MNNGSVGVCGPPGPGFNAPDATASVRPIEWVSLRRRIRFTGMEVAASKRPATSSAPTTAAVELSWITRACVPFSVLAALIALLHKVHLHSVEVPAELDHVDGGHLGLLRRHGVGQAGNSAHDHESDR